MSVMSLVNHILSRKPIKSNIKVLTLNNFCIYIQQRRRIMGDDKPGEISVRSHVRGVVNLKTLQQQAVTDACVFCLDDEKLALEILIFIETWIGSVFCLANTCDVQISYLNCVPLVIGF